MYEDGIIKSKGGVYMYRLAIKKLFRWKEKPNRKPLIIEGARQERKHIIILSILILIQIQQCLTYSLMI